VQPFVVLSASFFVRAVKSKGANGGKRIGELQAEGQTQAQMKTQMQTQAPAKIMELVEKYVCLSRLPDKALRLV